MQQFITPHFLTGNGEMATLIRQRDWSTSSVGPVENWPQSLRTTISTCLNARFPIVIWWGPDLILFYNDAYIPLLGNKHPTALGMPGAQAFAEIWTTIAPTLNSVLTQGEATWSENQLLPVNRHDYEEECYFTYSHSPVYDESGNVGGVFCIVTETTATVLAERKMREVDLVKQESAQRLQMLFEQAPVGVAILGSDLVFELTNPSYCELTGRPACDLIGKPLLTALPELAEQGFYEILLQVLKTGTPYVSREAPIQLMRNDQLETVYIDYVCHPRRELDGSITGIVAIVTDVTRSVRARQQVETNERLLNAMIRQTPLGVGILRGPGCVIELANPVICHLWGRTSEQVLNKHLFIAIPELVGQGFEELLAGVYETGVAFEGHELPAVIERNGQMETCYFDFVYEPLRNPEGNVERIMIVATDVTKARESRRLVEESEASYRELSIELDERVKHRTQDLERSNLDLMQFASVASHDLREPLRKIQSFGDRLEGLLAGRLNEEETDLFKRLVNATARMQTLISDVLRLSILSDQTARFEPVNLNAVISQIQDDLELIIHERNAQVTTNMLPTVMAEPGQMHQLFQNLISNALKFNNGTHPSIRVESLPLTAELSGELLLPGQNYVVVAVTDNGIGFDNKYKDKIFGMFQRLHGRNQYAGTGIGLTIVKKIVENHRGFIDVQSEPGQGTTFRIALPVQ